MYGDYKSRNSAENSSAYKSHDLGENALWTEPYLVFFVSNDRHLPNKSRLSTYPWGHWLPSATLPLLM